MKKQHEEYIAQLAKVNDKILVLNKYDGWNSSIKAECKICKCQWITPANSLLINKTGCPVCNCANYAVKGYTDIWTLAPKLGEFLNDKDDGYIYKPNSNKKVKFKCPTCNVTYKKRIIDVYNSGFSCTRCSDGISYPNKFMYSILTLLNIDFNTEYSPSWANNLRYDFYFMNKNKRYIVEMDGGLGHGNENNLYNEKYAKKTLRLDLIKNELAKENNIYVIRIDCNYKNIASRYEYIRNKILESELAYIFNFDKFDFDLANQMSFNSFVKIACDLYNNGNSIDDISNMLHLSGTSIRNYLHIGAKNNMTNYNPVIKKKVICINDNKVFESIALATKYYNLKSSSSVSACCNKKTKYVMCKGQKLNFEFCS